MSASSITTELAMTPASSDELDIQWYPQVRIPSAQAKECPMAMGISSRLQPWIAYWPPRSEILQAMWLQSEFPEVLTWRFNSSQPFDRPWRIWNSSARAIEEQTTHFVPIIAERGEVKTQARDEPTGNKIITPALTATAALEPCSGNDLPMPHIDKAIFRFLAPLDVYQATKPYFSRLPAGSMLRRTNIATEDQSIKVYDITGHETSFTLDDAGFHFLKCPVEVSQWTDDFVCETYVPKIEEWLMQYLQCEKVFIYAYSFRGRDVGGRGSDKAPFLRVHCDATASSCLRRLQLYFPDTASSLMKSRVRFINIWRALSTPVQNSPLAFCDYRTVASTDLIPADIIFPHYQDEAYEVLYNPDQHWLYKPGMERDDVVLFKLSDNVREVAPFCPHSAFMDPKAPDGMRRRVSLEVRSIAFG